MRVEVKVHPGNSIDYNAIREFELRSFRENLPKTKSVPALVIWALREEKNETPPPVVSPSPTKSAPAAIQ